MSTEDSIRLARVRAVVDVFLDEDEHNACDCCGWVTDDVKPYEDRGLPSNGRTYDLCQVCSRTHAGSTMSFPEQYPDRNAMRMIAWQTNYLAALITKEKQ